MGDIRMTYDAFYFYVVVFNSILGLLFGLFPLLVGMRLNNKKYALLGFGLTLIFGIMTGVLLAFPIALLFVWLILRSPAGEASNAAESESSPSS